MRIISGKNRGKLLSSPENWDTRPTSDKARQGIFNILEHAPFSQGLKDKNILDIFAGTGAMGLEALSRGAKYCCFIENSKNALRVLAHNIQSCTQNDAAIIINDDAGKLKTRPKAIPLADIIFMDPPYDKELVPPSINAIINGNWVQKGALIIVETHKNAQLPEFEQLELIRKTNYGINCFWIYEIK